MDNVDRDLAFALEVYHCFNTTDVIYWKVVVCIAQVCSYCTVILPTACTDFYCVLFQHSCMIGRTWY
jgi:hypothetical protein